MYESIEEARIYNFYDTPVQEISISDALKKFVDNIKKALVALIDKINDLLSKGNDNKIKSALKTVLNKAKAALNKTNSVNSKEDAKELAKEAKECKEEFDNIVKDNDDGFTVSNMLKKYLAAGDRYGIIGAIIGYANADPWFKTDDFDKAIQYALDNGISSSELYESFNPDIGEIEKDKSKWDEDYYSLARVYLKDNFCKERINHVKEVAKYVNANKGSSNKEDQKSKELKELVDRLHSKKDDPLVKRYLNDENAEGVRSAVLKWANLASKAGFDTFVYNVKYASNMLDDLFEDDDNKEYSKEPTKTSYEIIINLMKNNFSKKKFKDAVKIGNQIFK